MKIILGLIIFFLVQPLFCQSENTGECKMRLPQTVNSYQPVIVPVLTIDGRYLYFDRKIHPDNVGGINDEDDVWFSQKFGSEWLDPVNLRTLNTAESDILFSVSPDGRALVYSGGREEKSNPFRLVYLNNPRLKPEAINISNYYNDTSNYYAGLSADGDVLLLSLKRKTGAGSMDIYVSLRDKNTNKFSEPINLGESINTAGIEGSPFLAYDNKTLYFISNGRKGFGGLDIYMSRRLDESWQKWSEPVNPGRTVNSQFDESGVWLTALGDTAYIISSDTAEKRQGIYYACIPENMRPLPYTLLRGSIYYINNNQPARLNSTAEIILNEGNNDSISKYYSNPSTGEYYVALQPGKIYQATIQAGAFLPSLLTIDTRNTDKISYLTKDVVLKNATRETPQKPVINQTTVYFDFNSFLLSDSAKSIIRDFIKSNDLKNSRIRIAGFTDTTGTEEYNMNLSTKRARSAEDYIISLGVKRSSVVAQGRGESNSLPTDAENRKVVITIE